MTTEHPDEIGSDEQIAEMENRLLQGMLGCRTKEAVEAALTYAAFLNSVGITPENFPIFLKMLEVENHWVVDALMGEQDPFVFLSPIRPYAHFVGRLFAMLIRWQKGNIYHKNLMAILGVLQSVYSAPKHGYQIYPLSVYELNALGKHLEEDAQQDDIVNRTILALMGKLVELEDKNDAEMEAVAIHAAAIRNAFFDSKKRMDDVIPPILLVRIEGRGEIEPRKRAGVVEKTGAQVAVVMLDEPQAKASAPKTTS
jgi:hypothetical protein